MLGYERVDGRTAPSDAVYFTLYVDDASFEALNTVVTGSLSGATGYIVGLDIVENVLGITALTGNFVVDDILNGGSITTGPEESDGHPDVDTDIQWEFNAQEYYRDFITEVNPATGVGSVLGVWQYNGVKYAFRSNGTNVIMYKSSLSGWTEVTHFQLMQWDTGVLLEGDVVEGDTLTGLTSTATGTVKRFIKVSGSYGSNAVGYMVIDVTAGTFNSGEAIQKAAVTKFTSTTLADDIKLTLSTGNHDFRFVNYNFKGAEDQKRMYFTDAVNRGCEFDGTVLTPILTGMTIDKPMAIEAHLNHLFFAFDGGSLQHSAITEPLIFNPILGAAEIAVGDGIRGIKSIGGESLLISTDRALSSLYGNDAASWQVKLVAIDTGDVGNTLDVIGSPIMTTKRGIVRVDASDVFGNFESATISRRIRPLLDHMLRANSGFEVIGVNLVRDKNQYRLYFDDGTGIILTHDALFGEGALPQFTTFEYANIPACLASVAIDEGEEVVLFGGEDGFVYQEEKGFNFDGNVSNYTLRLPFHHLGSPVLRKAFKWVDVEIDTTRSTTLRMTYEFSDGQAHTASSAQLEYNISIGSIARWNRVNWDEFVWGGVPISTAPASLNGTGRNISLFFFGTSATDSDFTINSLTYQYIPRRLSRG